MNRFSVRTVSWIFTGICGVLFTSFYSLFGWVGLILSITLYCFGVASVYFDCAEDIIKLQNKEVDDLLKRARR